MLARGGICAGEQRFEGRIELSFRVGDVVTERKIAYLKFKDLADGRG